MSLSSSLLIFSKRHKFANETSAIKCLVICCSTFGFWANNPTQTDPLVGQQRALNLDNSLRGTVNLVLYVEVHAYIVANMHKNNS